MSNLDLNRAESALIRAAVAAAECALLSGLESDWALFRALNQFRNAGEGRIQ